MYLGFHRLAIIDPHSVSDQPFVTEYDTHTVYTMCNGEIYNYHELIDKYDLVPKTKSDCEVIPLLYKQFGVENLVDMIEGEFACVIVDIDNSSNQVKVCMFRDNHGVRPMFYICTDEVLAFSSTRAGLCDIVNPKSVSQFPPDKLEIFNFSTNTRVELTSHSSLERRLFNHHIDILITPIDSFDNILNNIMILFKRAVVSMMHADRPLGAFLSGGLDSSSVVSVAANHRHLNGHSPLRTFSIGLKGGTDEKYARMVSKHCGTKHTHYKFTIEGLDKLIREVIYRIESYDVTTVRDSMPLYLLGKKVSEDTDIKIVLICDGSDEVTSGYLYFHNAPSPEEADQENNRLLREIHEYDVRRADRGIASNGLEARVPFLDPSFVSYYLSIDPKLRIPINGVEKWLLRSAFAKHDLLPEEVLWRKKEAFSDGVSSVDKSWYQIIQDTIYPDMSDEELRNECSKYSHCPPTSKESLYYRKIFEEFFHPESEGEVKHFWLPKWCGAIQEPSARALDIY